MIQFKNMLFFVAERAVFLMFLTVFREALSTFFCQFEKCLYFCSVKQTIKPFPL